MASRDDFKEQLKAGKIVDALTMALSQAVELEITTWVASSSDSDIEASASGAKLSKPGHRLQTRINLLEGKIENEIGNQFIGTGPYRELRQFHQEQVTDSHKTIQNNLISLQKLFGILAVMRYPNPDNPAIEPESSGDIGPFLPPSDKVASGKLELPSTEEASVPSPVSPDDSLPFEDAGGLVPIPLAETQPLPAAPASSLEGSSLGMKENWEDLVLDEPFPPTPATSLEASSLEAEEDWGDMLEEEPSPATASQSSLDLEADEDWGDMLEEEPSPVAPAPSLETDEDLRDWLEETPEPTPATPTPSVDFSNQADEDWDELSPNTSEPSLEFSNLETEDWEEASQPYAAPSNSSLNLPLDEEWEEFPVDEPESFEPFSIASANGYSLAMGIEEHWQEFEVEELEPHPATSQAVLAKPTPALADAELEEFEALEELLSIEPELNQNSDYELFVEDFEEESFAQTSPQMHEGIDSPTASSDSLADLFGESSQVSELYSIEDALFSETPFEELSNVREVKRSPSGESPSDDIISSLDDSDLLAAFDDDDFTTFLISANESSVPAPPPPPPPPNQSKNQSN